MKNKKGFILYDDYKESFELLSEKDIKELLFAIFDYHKNGVINELSNTAKMAFMFIKNDLDRQLDNYNAICKRNRENGLKGGRPPDKPKKPSGLLNNPEKPRETQKSQQDTNKIQTRYKQEINKDDIYVTKFNQFWKAYPKRNGKKLGKKQTFELFLKLNENELDNVIEGTKRYSYQNNNPKDPKLFIRDRVWEDCNKYHGEIMEQAKSIYLEYPKKSGGIQAINSICEALNKIEYSKLLLCVKKFALKQKKDNTEEQYIKSAKNWFEQEMWLDIELEQQQAEKEF